MPLIGIPGHDARWMDDDYYRERLTALHSRSESLTPEEHAEYAALKEYSDQARRVAERAMIPGATERVDNDRAGYGRPAEAVTAPTDRGGWLSAPDADPALQAHRSAAMATIETYQRSGTLSDAAADRLDRVLREGDPDAQTARYLAAVGNPHYRAAFGKMLADPQMGHLRCGPEEVAAVREMNLAAASQRAALTTGSTGMPLPITIDPTIIRTGSGALNPVRTIANVETIGTHDWKGVSSDGVTAAYVQEGVEATDATPTLAGPQIATQQGRAFVQWTIESGQDWASLQPQLLQLVDDGRNVVDATMFLTGNGTNQPIGIFGGDATYSLGTAQRVQTAGTAAYAVGDPWLLKAAIPPRFISDSTFAAAPATLDTTYRFVGGNSAEPLQFDSGRSGPFLGRPKVEWSTMGTGSTTGTKLIIGGDFRTGYKIVDRLGMSAEIIPHMLGSNRLPLGVRGMYAYWRTGSAVVAKNALRYLEVK
jgi:HK97 family phage major capsid protein